MDVEIEPLLVRLERLETLFGDPRDSPLVESVVNSIQELETVLISAQSGRSQMARVFRRIEMLENLTDVSCVTEHPPMSVTLLEERAIREYTRQLHRLRELEAILNTETIQKLPEVELNRIMEKVLSNQEKCLELQEEFQKLLDYFYTYFEAIGTKLIILRKKVEDLEKRVSK